MKLPFHLVLEYAQREKDLVRQALLEFFLETDRPTPNQEGEAFPLFLEWLISDYRTPKGSSFLKDYKVYDKKSTSTIPKKGTLHARIAEIEKKWYFVGSNPIYFSLTFTPDEKITRETKGQVFDFFKTVR